METILISGAGIAGPALAFWLKAAGFQPFLIERSPALRTGGYVIDFWGLGYDIAESMGLVAEIQREGYHIREMRIADNHGRRIAGFGTRVLRELTGGRFVTIERSTLSRLLFERIKSTAETGFGDEIAGLHEDEAGVQVELRHGGKRRFDLVIGADGLHSGVRNLVFGRQDRFEKQLGFVVAAFEVTGYRPRDEDVYVIHNEPGRMLGRFALHGDRTLFLFVVSTKADIASEQPGPAAQKAMLRESFGDGAWECSRILDELDRAQNLYFDRVSQIKLERWSKGRIALVGDAAFCPSLLAGQGAALAMTAAYVLAGELGKASGNFAEAFSNYEKLVRPFITKKQTAAEHFAAAFAPRTRRGLFLRNQIVKACAIPGLARVAFGRDMIDSLKLPEYRWPALA